MGKITFYSMRLNVTELKVVVKKTGFTGLVFQPIIENAAKQKDEFILVCYELYDETYEHSAIPFVTYNKRPWLAIKKVMFGNLPIPKITIETIIKDLADGTYLYFYPEDYDDYVKYIITTNPDYSGLLDVDYELKPSPPAIPPEFHSAKQK